MSELHNYLEEIPEVFWLEDGAFQAKSGIVPIDAIADLPSVQGIYIVITDNDEILYVGRAGDLHERWRTGHHKVVNFFTYAYPNIMYVELPELSRGELSKLETYYIRKLKPLAQG